jgi:hypothetical protein
MKLFFQTFYREKNNEKAISGVQLVTCQGSVVRMHECRGVLCQQPNESECSLDCGRGGELIHSKSWESSVVWVRLLHRTHKNVPLLL